MTRSGLRGAVLITTVVGLIALAPSARAEHLFITAVQPDEVQAGDIIEVQVLVQSDETRSPVANVTVVARRSAEIAGFSGEVEVARAVTDERGIASLRWQVRGGTSETVIIAYGASGEEQLESAPLSVVSVLPGPQLSGPDEGVQIPGLGAWILITVLVGIWAVVQFALVGPIHIARHAPPAVQGEPLSEGGDE